ncbi:MAG: inositol monophosphatase [Ilumatobacteraceae bacterium]|nr:inositol monophosphatase [Ilumatobacteraceae bacterium]
MSADPSALLALAEPIAVEVADHLRASLTGAGPAVSSKSTPTDLVTELDTWAEAHITERILAARPDDAIQGEEGADVAGTSGVTWSVDPIDGTVNFVHGIPGFCVSIAARVDGRTVAAVVASPLHGEVFTATLGGGAFCNGTPIRCAAPASAARSVVATGFGYDPRRRTRQAEVVARVIGQIADIRRFGAAAVDLCWVACGRVDGYWEVGLNAWDHAAGALIAREAGATVTGLEAGTDPSERFTLAAPPEVWAELGAILVDAGAADV